MLVQLSKCHSICFTPSPLSSFGWRGKEDRGLEWWKRTPQASHCYIQSSLLLSRAAASSLLRSRKQPEELWPRLSEDKLSWLVHSVSLDTASDLWLVCLRNCKMDHRHSYPVAVHCWKPWRSPDSNKSSHLILFVFICSKHLGDAPSVADCEIQLLSYKRGKQRSE